MTDTYVHSLAQPGDSSSNEHVQPRPVTGLGAAPDYLQTYYWWAYIHPRAVQFFERQWLVNAILWGNYGRLRDAALTQLADASSGATLQVACAYGDLTLHLAQNTAAGGGTLDVLDVLPVQLQNLRAKLPSGTRARLFAMDSSHLQLPGCSYDQALLFFLLHEQPLDVRRGTLNEVLRVVKPGGRIVVVDYAQPRWWHPLRYLWRVVLAMLEPFALDLWRNDIATWMPVGFSGQVQSRSFFGGLYKMTTFTRGQNS
jgi:ubiquinone/menaquinone biosynthesis C-methylase UbiE